MQMQENAQMSAIKTPLAGSHNLNLFLTQLNFACELYSRSASQIYDDFVTPNRVKCSFAYSNFAREPAEWFAGVQVKKKELLDDWSLLKNAMKLKYGDPNHDFNNHVEWSELKMINSLDKYENRYRTLLDEMQEEDVPSKRTQLLHYIKGLRSDLITIVMNYYVQDKEGYTIEAAKAHARLAFQAKPVQNKIVQEKPFPRAKAVHWQSQPNGSSQRIKEAAPMLPNYQYFAPDQNLKNCRRSVAYPDYWPHTLGGTLSHDPGSEGHKLRMFLGANNLCNFCREPGHRHADCPHNQHNHRQRSKN
jgi:Retrotransposon gag protein